MFAPLWALLALSLWVHWESWQTKPIMFGAIASLPILAALLSTLARERWRLELTPEALIHHAIGRSERFEWARMGPLEIKAAPVSDLLFARTFWFAFPLDAARSLEERGTQLLGRRILCVFGDHAAPETVRLIEEWRALYARAAA